MRSKGTRIPFDHVKNIYGNNMEHYSYQEIKRCPELSRKAYMINNRKGYRYEKVREKILEYVTLAFSVFMLGMGIYFILTAMTMTA
jgi:hypothetical protein